MLSINLMRVILSQGKLGAKKLVLNHGLSWIHVNKNNLESVSSLCRKLGFNKNALFNVFQKNHDVFMFHGFFAIAIPLIHNFEGQLKSDSILVLMKKNLIITFCYSMSENIIEEVVNTIRLRTKHGFNELLILRRLLQEVHENTVELIDKREEVVDSLVESAAILKIEIDKLVQLVLGNRRYLSKIKEILHDFKRLLFDIDEELPPEYEKLRDLKKINQLSVEVSGELSILYTLEQKLSEALSLHDLLLSNKMNSIVTKLTVIAAVFLVPSLIAGIFGMNNLFNTIELFSIGALTVNSMQLEFFVLGLTILVMFYFINKKNMLKL